MGQLKKLLTLISLLFSTHLWAIWGTGWSTYPMLIDNKFLSTEVTGDLSNNGGVGLQGRYIQKLNRATVLDGGIGFSGGERSGRVFAGLDYEIFPDYQAQPRISVKATFENSREFNLRKNKIGMNPIVSKGFNFWGKEAYPYLSAPMGISLDNGTQSYDTFMKVSAGITGKIPYGPLSHLTANLEGTINVKNSYSGVFLGLSFPIDGGSGSMGERSMSAPIQDENTTF